MDVDVVVVVYRSRRHLRRCVEPLCGQHDIHVIVVDNDCPEGSLSTVEDLPVEVVRMGRNAGFGAGSNAGARAGERPAILFLNPDARITPADVRLLAATLDRRPGCAAVGPRILEADGDTQLSVRRAPRLGSAFGEALFLHHAVRQARWPTEIVRDGYDTARDVEWLSGAVLCVRRSAFERLGGFDERLFLYCEDTDLCVRLRAHSYTVRYEPTAVARHQGGASAPRPTLVALKARARIIYARIHERGGRYAAFRIAYLVNEILRLPVDAVRRHGDPRARLGALRIAIGPTRVDSPRK